MNPGAEPRTLVSEAEPRGIKPLLIKDETFPEPHHCPVLGFGIDNLFPEKENLKKCIDLGDTSLYGTEKIKII